MARKTKRTTTRRQPARPKVIDLKAEEIVSKPDGSSSDTPSAAKKPGAQPNAAKTAGGTAADATKTAKSTATKADAGPAAAGKEAKPEAAKSSTVNADAPKTGKTDAAAAKPAEGLAGGNGKLVAAGVAGLIAAAIVGAWLYQSFGGRTPGTANMAALEAMRDQITTTGATIQTHAARLQQLEQGMEDAASAAQVQQQARDARVGPLEQAIDELRVALTSAGDTEAGSGAGQAALKLQLDDLGKQLEIIKERIAAVEIGLGNVESQSDKGAFNELKAAMAALSQSVEDLKSKQGAQIRQTVSALGQGFAKLSSKVASGEPFQSELDALVAVAPTLPGIVALRGVAEKGVASLSGLAGELEAVADEIERKNAEAAAAGQQEGGVFSIVTSKLNQVVKIRKIGEIDWPQELRKAAQRVRANDLKAVAQELTSKTGDQPEGMAGWIERAQVRISTDEALNQLSSAVLRQLAASGTNG